MEEYYNRNMSNDQTPPRDELWISGQELKDAVLQLIKEGNARHLVIWSESGKKLLEIPLTGGVAVGGALVVLSPFLAGLAAIAAVVRKVRLEVVRDTDAS